MKSLYQNSDINILVIDDNTENIQIIGQVLLAQDYHVSYATSGYEALKLIETSVFDLILLDILMPGMDGFEVCKKIKSNPSTAHTPIIFLTAKSDKESVIQGLKLGANDYIAKPFNDSELLLRVKTQVDLMKQREKLENVNQLLEDEVKIKTAQITLAKQKLSVLEKAKSDFLTLISHEFRTPLNIINGFTEILKDALSNTRHIDELNILKGSTDSLISLTETALLITEIQLGKYEIDYHNLDLKALCNNVAVQARENYPQKQFQYKIESTGGEHFARGDENLINNIISKITENSIHVIGTGCKVKYTISGTETQTRLQITDNGPGFTEPDLEKLFNIFSKNGPDSQRQGFGLGLAAVKLVMDLHSGDVKAKNLPGGGASVVLTFPINSPDGQAETK